MGLLLLSVAKNEQERISLFVQPSWYITEFSDLGCPMGEVASLTRLLLYTSAPVLSREIM